MMERAWGARLILALGLSVGALSCVAGVELREDAKLIEKKVANARERGSYRCAPLQLARAEAQLEFLQYELSQGDFLRAERHHRAALASINDALKVTDPDQCADKQVLIIGDADGDGIPDPSDRCVHEPEDRDGFEDEDGCPDPDNDADTVLDVNDRCPNIPEDLDGNEDEDGCPEEENLDSDGDGILDNVDQCPTEPEDLDQFQDEDGCPDPDNDADTVLDIVDSCPLQPGPASNNGCPVADRDGDGITDDVDQCPDVPGSAPKGCPRRVLVVKTDNKIEIRKQIRFDTNRATIKGRISFEILDQVGAVLKSNPTIKVMIEGHTDSVGPASYNLQLSDDRANSVRQALIDRGIDGARVEAIGYGETKPIASNKRRRGRAANRRVEFNIVQSGSGAAGP